MMRNGSSAAIGDRHELEGLPSSSDQGASIPSDLSILWGDDEVVEAEQAEGGEGMKILKKYFRRLTALKANETNPRVFLEQMLENCAHFKSVAIVITYQDGSQQCDWSKMTTEEMAMSFVVLQEYIRKAVIEKTQIS